MYDDKPNSRFLPTFTATEMKEIIQKTSLWKRFLAWGHRGESFGIILGGLVVDTEHYLRAGDTVTAIICLLFAFAAFVLIECAVWGET